MNFLRAFSRFLKRIFDELTSHPFLTSAVTLAITLILGMQLRQIRVELRIYDLIDPAFQSTSALQKMKDSFKDGHSVTVFLSSTGGRLTQSQVCRIRDWVDQESRENPELLRVFSAFDLRIPQSQDSKLWYPLMLNLNCEKPSDVPFDLSQLRSSPWGLLVTDEKAQDLAIQFEFKDSSRPSAFGKFDPAPVGALLESVQKNLLSKDPKLKFQMNGDASFQWHFQNMLKHDALVNPLLLLIIILFFRLFYGTWKSGLLFLSSLVISTLATYGLMALVGAPLDLLTNNLFLMLCIAGLEDFLFVFHHHRMERMSGSHASLQSSFRELLVPGFFTSLTTVLGFGSLVSSRLHIIRNFGLCAAVAAVIEWAVTFYFLSSLCRLLPQKTVWVRTTWFSGKSRFFVKGSAGKGAIKASFLLFALGLIAFFYLNYEDSPRHNFPADHPHSESFQYLRETRGWEGLINVVFPGAEDVNAVLEEIKKDGNVAKVENPLDVISFMQSQSPPELSPLIAREVKVSSFFGRYLSPGQELRVAVYLKSIDLSDLNKTLSHVRDVCKGGRCEANGEAVVLVDYSEQVSRTLVGSFVISLLLVAGLIVWLSHALGASRKWNLLYSLLWCPVVTVLWMAVFHFPINLITSVFLAILVGLTGDNAIQFLFASKQGDLRQGLKSRRVAATELLLLLILGSFVFLGLTLIPLKILGLMFAAGFVTTLLGDIWLLSGLIER